MDASQLPEGVTLYYTDKAEQAKLLYQRSFHFAPPVQKTQC